MATCDYFDLSSAVTKLSSQVSETAVETSAAMARATSHVASLSSLSSYLGHGDVPVGRQLSNLLEAIDSLDYSSKKKLYEADVVADI